MRKGKYIVTGGAGLIGSALIWELNRAGIDDILVVDHLGNTTDKWKNLAPLRFDDYLEKDTFREKLAAGGIRPARSPECSTWGPVPRPPSATPPI